MIKKIIYNLRKSKNFKGTAAEKISAYFTVSRLQAKDKLFKKKNTLVSENFFGYKVFGYDYFTLNYLFNEVFLSNEYYFEPDNKEPVIFDCGSNIGMSVLYFKKTFPNSRVIAFEANPHAFKLLQKNSEVNKLNNVELNNFALYDRETEISFFIGDNIGTLKGSINKERGGKSELKIPTQRLSSHLKKFASVDLVKIDVEGAEINILHDLVESGAINIAKEYIIEYHHNVKGDKSMLAGFLEKFESNGFSYNIKTSFSKLGIFQDILIHFYK